MPARSATLADVTSIRTPKGLRVGSSPLLPTLHRPTDGEALRFGQHSVTHRELSVLAATLQAPLAGARRVAVWAAPQLQTCVAVVAALAAGGAAGALKPQTGAPGQQPVVSPAGPRP